ncbi:MAG: YjbH domain-containing protein [Armatimonadota bacterium]|nr:YjbH domain-containing protein [Armatimonadota bacterium]
MVTALPVITPGRASPSLPGPVGNLMTPSADVPGLGYYWLAMRNHNHRNYITGAYGVFSRVEVSGTVMDPTRPGGGEAEFALNAKVLLTRESSWAPAIAAGVWDLADWTDDSYYVVATKRIRTPWRRGPVCLSVGYMKGMLDGTFAALEVPVSPSVSAIAEFDTSHPNFAARIELPRGFLLDIGALNWTLGIGVAFGAQW